MKLRFVIFTGFDIIRHQPYDTATTMERYLKGNPITFRNRGSASGLNGLLLTRNFRLMIVTDLNLLRVSTIRTHGAYIGTISSIRPWNANTCYI